MGGSQCCEALTPWYQGTRHPYPVVRDRLRRVKLTFQSVESLHILVLTILIKLQSKIGVVLAIVKVAEKTKIQQNKGRVP